MTISDSPNKVEHTGNGVIVDFDFTYKWNSDPATIYVWLDGVLQLTGYTITDTGTPGVGGRVTFDVAPAQDVVVTIVRNMPMDQTVDYTPYDRFPAEVHEGALDKLTMIVQQQQEAIDRTFKAPIAGAEPGVDYTMPPYAAGKGLMWHETLKQFDNTPDDIANIVTDANAAADRAEAAADRAEAAYVTLVGMIMICPADLPPDGWVNCDGRSLSKTTYPDLFNVIGYNYGGSGDNFNIPDFRGKFVRSTDFATGVDPDAGSRSDRGDGTTGDWVGTNQGDEIVSHSHQFSDRRSNYGCGSGPDPVSATGLSTQTTQSQGGNETRPINIGMMFIIRLIP